MQGKSYPRGFGAVYTNMPGDNWTIAAVYAFYRGIQFWLKNNIV